MSGDELQVIPEDLTGKAAQIKALSWSAEAAQTAVVPPDALHTTNVAITNLRVNAEAMWAYQEFGRLEGLRLARTLDNVAAAYAAVDKLSGEDIDSTVGGPGSPGSPEGTQYPEPVDIPAPPHPPDMPIPKGQLVSEQLLFPPATQRALEAGDGGASLQSAAVMWRDNAESLADSAQQFETNSLLWEGEAADAAYAKFNAYRDWLISLAGSWKLLADEADHLVEAHSAARRDNEPIAEEYARLEREMAENPSSASNLRRMMQMSVLQGKSEEVRNRYVRDGQPRQIQPEEPPLTPVVSGIPVTVDDHRRARRPLPHERPNQELGGGPAGSGGSPPAGEPPDSAERQTIPPMTDPEQAAQGAQQDGSQGGSQGGGEPGGSQGGGSPNSGQPGAGMPTNPKLPTDPSLRPAAAGGGAGAGGGGKAPPSSLQPAVGAETVAPTPRVTPGAPAAAAGPTTGMGGGMGGMAPMMHGAKGEGSGDKKRNPQLSEDEDLYTEDRPWTEPVIGNRVRRRGAPDGAGKESQ